MKTSAIEIVVSVLLGCFTLYVAISFILYALGPRPVNYSTNHIDLVCLDGVEYLRMGQQLTPHQLDGKSVECK